jgi:hypothetical protein
MRRLAPLVLLLALLAAVPAAASPPDQQAAAVAVVEPPFDGPARDNFVTLTYFHFGQPAAGQVVIQGWIRTPKSDLGLPTSDQAGCQAIRLLKVSRVALRCLLHTRGGTSNDDATSLTVNSADVGNPLTLRIASPSITANGPTPQFCRSWVEVRWAARWPDGTLTSGKSLQPETTLPNPNCP